MNDYVEYHIEIEGTKGHKSFAYKTREKAMECFYLLTEKFNENVLQNKSEIKKLKDVVNLSMCEVNIGRIPSGVMAPISPNEWYVGVYDEIMEAAQEFYNFNT